VGNSFEERALSRRTRATRSSGRNPLLVFLPMLFPIGATIWFFLQDEETRRGMLERVPEGAGGRALDAGIGFSVLVGLAWIVLPVTYHGHRWSRRGLEWCLTRPVGQRILLAPAILVLGLTTVVFGALFAVDALCVLVAFLGTLCLGAWIVEPSLFGGKEGLLGLFGG